MGNSKNNYKVIGIAGPADCGKDHAANYLIEHLTGYTKKSFANPLKDMLRIGLGFTVDQLDGDLKEEIDERYGCSPRYVMQQLGTEWGRDKIHPDVWVMAMAARVEKAVFNAIIPDVRFENEAAFVRENGVLVHITGRDRKISPDHVSERMLEIDTRDIIIRNDDNLEAFHSYLDEAIKWL